MKPASITLSAVLLLSLGACNEGATETDQHVEGDECPLPELIVITDDSDGAKQLGISHYIARSADPRQISLDVVGLGGEHIAQVEAFSEGIRGGRLSIRMTDDPSSYEVLFTADGVEATRDGRVVGRWHGDPDGGLVQDGEFEPGAELAVSIGTTAIGGALNQYALFGFELSSWKCIKLKAKALAYATLCITGAVAAGFACATVLACVAAAAGTVVACINYVDTYDAACDCDCWPWKC